MKVVRVGVVNVDAGGMMESYVRRSMMYGAGKLRAFGEDGRVGMGQVGRAPAIGEALDQHA